MDLTECLATKNRRRFGDNEDKFVTNCSLIEEIKSNQIFSKHSLIFYQTFSSFAKHSPCSPNVLQVFWKCAKFPRLFGEPGQRPATGVQLGNIWRTLCDNLRTIWGTFVDCFAKCSLNIYSRNNRKWRMRRFLRGCSANIQRTSHQTFFK